MKIIERAKALNLGEKTFYTGRPCRNGHNTYRYTQSGSCSACVNSTKGSLIDPTLPARKAAKGDMVKARFRIYDVDRDTFAASVWIAAMMRYPFIQQSDVDPKLLPVEKEAGTAMYSFYCHADDVESLRGVANSLKLTHSIDLPAAMRKVAQQTAGYLPVDTTPPLNYD